MATASRELSQRVIPVVVVVVVGAGEGENAEEASGSPGSPTVA